MSPAHWDGLQKVAETHYTSVNANQEGHLTGYSTKMIALLTLPPSLLGWLIRVSNRAIPAGLSGDGKKTANNFEQLKKSQNRYEDEQTTTGNRETEVTL